MKTLTWQPWSNVFISPAVLAMNLLFNRANPEVLGVHAQVSKVAVNKSQSGGGEGKKPAQQWNIKPFTAPGSHSWISFIWSGISSRNTGSPPASFPVPRGYADKKLKPSSKLNNLLSMG